MRGLGGLPVLGRAVLVATLLGQPAVAQTVWERARDPELGREAQILSAVYRTLEGTGDALDQMMARTAFVDLARGTQYRDPAILVLLVRLRRQLGLEPDGRSLQLLGSALEGEQPRTIQTLAALEYAHVLLEWNRRSAP